MDTKKLFSSLQQLVFATPTIIPHAYSIKNCRQKSWAAKYRIIYFFKKYKILVLRASVGASQATTQAKKFDRF